MMNKATAQTYGLDETGKSGDLYEPVTTYHEQKIGKTLYRVTHVFAGKIDLVTALEELVIKKMQQNG